MKRLTRNAFRAFPKLPMGFRQFGGIHSHPGFHTTTSMSVAKSYAIARTVRDHTNETKNGIHYVTDYPVVVGVNTFGFKKEPDYDADISARASLDDQLGYLLDEGLDEHSTDDDISDKANSLIENSEYNDDTDYNPTASDYYFRQESNHLSHPLTMIYEHEWFADFVRSYAANKRIPNHVLYAAAGQFRYLEDIPESRVLRVWYINPMAEPVFDYQGSEDAENEEAKIKKEWPGFEIFDIDQAYGWSINPGYKLVFSNKDFSEEQIEMFKHKTDIEYHGTSLSLLLAAAPFLKDELPGPPTPPYKPEDMEDEEYEEASGG